MLGHKVVQVRPVHVFHHHERDRAGPVDVEDADDVGVIERGDRLRLAIKPLHARSAERIVVPVR